MRLLPLLVCLLAGCVSPRARFQNRFESKVWITGEINEESLTIPTMFLRFSREPITFWIDSPGGDVNAGLAFIDEMRATQRRGVPVTCIVDGMAASMAGVILEACDLRLMKKQSSILFHTVSVSGAEGGNQWTYERLVQDMKEWNKRLAIFVSGRLKISLAQYEKNVENKDWWLGHEEALEVGAVDGVL